MRESLAISKSPQLNYKKKIRSVIKVITLLVNNAYKTIESNERANDEKLN